MAALAVGMVKLQDPEEFVENEVDQNGSKKTNTFCGMQAVMYCASWDCQVDFWWVKPSKTADSEGNFGIEQNTLSRHAKGPHKNDPGRSKQFYKPLADLFGQEGQCRDGSRFGIERVGSCTGGRAVRAYIEQE